MEEPTPASKPIPTTTLENHDSEMVQRGFIKLLVKISSSNPFEFKFEEEKIKRTSLAVLAAGTGKYSLPEETPGELTCRFYALAAVQKYQEIISGGKKHEEAMKDLRSVLGVRVEVEGAAVDGGGRIMGFILQTIDYLGGKALLFPKTQS